MTESPIYRETIRAPLWASAPLLVLVAGAAGALLMCRTVEPGADPMLFWALSAGAIATLVIALVLILLLGRLSLRCESRKLRVQLGFLPLLRMEIALDEIVEARPVRYQPLRHFGGWGVRQGRYRGIRTALYALRGAKGVLLVLRQPVATHGRATDHVLLGSLRPVALVDYLRPRIGAAQDS